MTRKEYRSAMDDVIYLCGCMVNGDSPEPTRVGKMDLSHLYEAAESHQLTCMVGYALEAVGIYDDAFVQAKSKAIRKTVLMDAERVAILGALDNAGIWYMPLKGIVLKDLYPKIGMRQMADNDILFDSTRDTEVRSIMESLGYHVKQFDVGFHDVYHKEPLYNLEMHRALYDPAADEKLSSYYMNVQERLIRDESEKREWHFSNEDFYLYMVAHEYKHYSHSGTGLRSLLDTYVFLKAYNGLLDEAYISEEAEKMGISDFERQNRQLSLNLFGKASLSEENARMLDYILISGTYGTESTGIRNQIRRKGRISYLFCRVFLPYKKMVGLYPVLKRFPFLLPVFWPVRIIAALKNKPDKVMRQLKGAFLSLDQEQGF